MSSSGPASNRRECSAARPYKIRLAWLRAVRLGEPIPWYKLWFAVVEGKVRYLIWRLRHV